MFEFLSPILVAVDGSEHSDSVVEYSCRLAKKFSEPIILIYVSKYPELIGEYAEIGGASPSPKSLQYVASAEEVTSKLAEKIEEAGVPHEVILETGDAAEKIVKVARERNVEMIVLGLRGLHGIGKIRSLGSVARKVIENSSFPVVVVT